MGWDAQWGTCKDMYRVPQFLLYPPPHTVSSFPSPGSPHILTFLASFSLSHSPTNLYFIDPLIFSCIYHFTIIISHLLHSVDAKQLTPPSSSLSSNLSCELGSMRVWLVQSHSAICHGRAWIWPWVFQSLLWNSNYKLSRLNRHHRGLRPFTLSLSKWSRTAGVQGLIQWSEIQPKKASVLGWTFLPDWSYSTTPGIWTNGVMWEHSPLK